MNSVSDEELQKIKEFMESEEGKAKIREAINNADETSKIIDKMRDIDLDKLREPFTI